MWYYDIGEKDIKNSSNALIESFTLRKLRKGPRKTRGFLYGRKEMLKSCPYCGRIHDPHTVCPKKPVYDYPSNRHRSKAGDLRHRNIWKEKSLEIRRRDKGLCRVCLSRGILTTRNLSVHHIIPINEQSDLWLDNDNLITVCNKCHDEAEAGLIDREALRMMAATEAKLYPGGGRAVPGR